MDCKPVIYNQEKEDSKLKKFSTGANFMCSELPLEELEEEGNS